MINAQLYRIDRPETPGGFAYMRFKIGGPGADNPDELNATGLAMAKAAPVLAALQDKHLTADEVLDILAADVPHAAEAIAVVRRLLAAYQHANADGHVSLLEAIGIGLAGLQ